MKPQEAIDFINDEVDIDIRFCSKEKVNKTIKVFEFAIEAIEKQIPKKVIHIHQEYEKHDWYKNSDGTVDDYHFEYDPHSGVECKRCGEMVCTLCHKDYDKEAGKCVIDKKLCPSCKRYIAKYKYCPDCGQALDWSEAE